MADEIVQEEDFILTEAAIDAEWKRIQKKTFTRWCNEHLKKIGPYHLIEDLGKDLEDGIRLILLLELISQKKIGKYNKKPRVHAQKMENIELALNFITKKEKIRLVNIGSGDIINGNEKLILGLIWTLILHYQISIGFGIEAGADDDKDSKGGGGGGKTGKQALLEWIQNKLPEQNISNFTGDWNDGTKIAALVDSVAPGLCPEHKSMDPANAHQNASHAMKLAEDWLDVPMLLGPEDMVNPHVDELSMMTYLSQYPEAKLKEGAPIKTGTEEIKVQPELIKVGELHVPEEAGCGEDVWVEIDCSEAGKDEVKAECKGQTTASVDIEELDAMKYRIKFTPEAPEVYNLTLLYGDNPIPGGTFNIDLLPKANAKMVKHLGTFIPDDHAAPVVLKFDARKAGKGEMRVRVNGILMAGPVDSEVQCVDEETKEYEVSFIPSGADTYNVDVYWSDETIPGSPIFVKIVYPNEVLVSDPVNPPELLQPVTFHVDTQYAGPGVLSASCSGQKAGDVDAEIIRNEADNTKYSVSFCPVEADLYSLRLSFNDTEIKHSPIEVAVKSKPELVKVGELHVPEEAGCGEDVWVEIDCSEAGKDEVKAECKGQTKAPINIEELDSMKYRIKFTPEVPDVYNLTLLYGDNPIPGGTFNIDLLPKTNAKLVKHLGTFIPDDTTTPVVLKFDAKEAGKGKMRAQVNGVLMARPVDSEVKCVDEETKDYEVWFVPSGADTYNVDVYWSDEAIPASPIYVKIVYPERVLVNRSADLPEVFQPAVFHVDTQYAGPGVLTASCSGKETGTIDTDIIRNEADNTKYDVSFRPLKDDTYSLRLFFDGYEIKDSPIETEIKTKSRPELVKVGDLHVPEEAGCGEDVWVEIDCSEAGKDEVKAECKAQSKGLTNIPVNVEELDSVKYRIKFTPEDPDVYNLTLLYGDNPIPGGTFNIDLLPKTNAKMVKHLDTIVPDDHAAPVVLKFDAKEAGKGKMRAQVNGALMAGPVDSEVKCVDEVTKEYEVSFIPRGADTYNVDVYWSDETIPASPIYVKIVYPEEVLVSRSANPLELLQPVVFHADTQYAGPGVLTASCSGKEAGDTDVDIIRNEVDNTKYDVSFRPLKDDSYSLRLFFDGHEIKHSPIETEIKTKSRPELIKVGELHVPEEAGCGEDVWVEIDCSEAGKDEVKAECKGKTEVPVGIDEYDSMKYRIKFTPEDPDVYNLTLLYGDNPIPGGTFDIDLLPKTNAKMVKHLDTTIPDDRAAPVVLKFDAKEAGKGKMRAQVNGALMAGPVDFEVKCVDEATKEYKVSFVPSGADTYNVDVYWSDETIPASPIYVKIVYPEEVLVSRSANPLELLQPVIFHADTQYAGPGVLTASCSGKEAGDTDVDIIRNEVDNTKYDVSFRPLKDDSYSLRLFFDGHEIKHSPIETEIKTKSRPELIKVDELHVPEEAGCGEDVWVEIDCSKAGKDEVKAECKGKTEVPVGIDEYDSMKYRIKFTPEAPDVYNLTLLYGDNPIPGGTFNIDLLPKTNAKMVKHLGTFIPDDHAAPVVLKFDAKEAGKGKMRAQVNGALMAGPVDSEVKCVDEEVQEYEVSFIPCGADTYNVDVYWSDETIPASPIYVKIVYPEEVLVSRSANPLELLQPVVFHADTQYAGPGVLTASCSGKEAGDTDVDIIRNEVDNTKYDVLFRPLKDDIYSLKIFFDGVEIKNSPFETEIKTKSKPELIRVGDLHVPEEAGCGEDVWVEIDCSEAGKDEVKAECTAQSKDIPVSIKELDPMKYRIKFTPEDSDVYNLTLLYGDNPIPGGTFNIDLLPKTNAKLVKHLDTTIPDDHAAPVVLKFDAKKAGKGKMRAKVNGALMAGPVDSEVKCVDEKTKEYEVSFIPSRADIYNVDVYWSDEAIPASPISLKIVDPSKVIVSHPVDPPQLLHPVVFDVDTQYAGPGVLTASCSGKEIGKRDVDIVRSDADNTKYDVSFRPLIDDTYSLKIFFDGIEIKDSPIETQIKTKSRPYLIKVGELHVPEEAGCGEDVWVEIDCSEAGKDEVKAECKGELKGQVKIPVNIEEYDSMKHRIKFTPEDPDVYNLTLLYGDNPIPGGTFNIDLLPKTNAKLVKHLDTIIPNDRAAPVVLKFDAKEAGKGKMRAQVNSALRAGPVDSEVKCVDKETKEYEVSFIPSGADTYNVDVYWSDETIPASPIFVKIIYPDEVLVSDPVNPPELSQPVIFHADTHYAGPGVLSASCSGKKSGDVDIKIIPNEADNTKYDISFQPKEADSYTVKFFFDNIEIKRSPMEVEVKAKERVDEQCVAVLQQDTHTLPDFLVAQSEQDSGPEPTKLNMYVGAPFTLLVDAEEEGSTLTATASGINVGDTPVSLMTNEPGRSFKVFFNPTEPDVYTIDVKLDGTHVPSSPFIINYTKPKETEPRKEVSTHPTIELEVEPQQEVPTHPITKPYFIRYVPEDGVDDLMAYAIHDHSCVRTALKIRTKKEGTTLLVFQAEQIGLHFIHIQQGGKEIYGSPFKLEIVPSDPSACVVVDIPEKSFVGEETAVTVDAYKAGSGDMRVVATVPVGGKGTEFSHVEKENGKFLIQFTPKVAGKHMLSIKWDGVVIPDCPVPVNVYELTEEVKQSRDAASRVKVHDSKNVFSNDLDHTQGARFTLLTAKAGQGNLFIRCRGPGNADIKVIKKKDSVYGCRVLPAVSGKYDLTILWNGFPIPGHPYQLNFTTNKTYIINELDLETEKFVVNKTYQYNVDCGKHEGVLEVFANPSDCAEVDVHHLKESIHTVKITPLRIGNHEIALKFAGRHIFKSPYHVQFDAAERKLESDAEAQDKLLRLSGIDFPLDLSDPMLDMASPVISPLATSSQQSKDEDAKVTAFGPGLKEGVIGQEGNFTIKTSGCGAGKLVVTIEGPRGSFKTCLRHHPDQERTVLGRYDPTHIGKYTINIQWNDQPIEGSPFEVNVKPQEVKSKVQSAPQDMDTSV